jgi:hypothetical protein
LNDLVAHIDASRLFVLRITFFNRILFDTPQLIEFISRSPELKAPEVHLAFGFIASVKLKSLTSKFEVEISLECRGLDQVSALKQVCTRCLPLLFVKSLFIYGIPSWKPNRRDNIENSFWLELLQPFSAVKHLYLCEEFTRRIGPAMRELVGGGMSEVLPTLQSIFLEGLHPPEPVHEGIQQFVARRQASYPIAISRWDRDARIFQEIDD